MKKTIFIGLLLLIIIIPHGSNPAPPSGPNISDYTAYPAFSSEGAPPLVMLVLSRDHKLYYEAYNDALDLDGDGVLETGYKHDIDYYGYFDPYKCYTYSSSGTPKFVITQILPDNGDKYCPANSGQWSGNFLNWLSMSRMDAIRKVLYGGYRSSDSAGATYATVLEGVYIPQDAHSWGKEYNGSDTNKLTPYTTPSSGQQHLFCMTSLSAGDAHKIRVLTNKTNRIWEWASKERPVCDTSLGTPTDFYVRVEVCRSDLVGTTGGLESNCVKYKDTTSGVETYKPVGLLQKFGEGRDKQVCSKSYKECNNDNMCDTANGEKCVYSGGMYFGLITGSYMKNLSGGVLRSTMGDINDEIETNNGMIKNLTGIIKTLNVLSTIEFTYGGSYTYDCGWITTRAPVENECVMWGNPIGEMMYETVRYFANKGAPTSDFTYSTPNDESLQLPKPDWDKPYEIYPSCSKGAMVVMSDVSPSYDSDKVPGSYFNSFTGDLTGLNVYGLADTIGLYEGINTTNKYIGQSGSTNDFICSSKSVSSLGQLRGLCPEDPTKQGSYYSSSVAYYGKTLFDDHYGYPEINTYSLAFASPVPEINITAGSNTVTLVPIGKSVRGCLSVDTYCYNKCTVTYNGAGYGVSITNCSSDAYCPSNQIVDFYVDTLSTGYGKFRINFEDVEQGADHDMDAMVLYEYCVGTACSPAISSNQVKVTLTSSYAAGCIGQALGFVISGTSDDGTYLPVRDADTAMLSMPLTWSKTFTASSSSSSASLISNPLWYASKWGGFDEENSPSVNNRPDLSVEWDNDGDGTPDTYYFVANPGELETKLSALFASISGQAGSGTAASVLATTGDGEGASYQAYFFSKKRDSLGNGEEIKYLGFLHGVFLDSFANLREDTDGDKQIDMVDDYIVNITYTPGSGTLVYLYKDSNGNGLADDCNSNTTFCPVNITGIPVQNVCSYTQPGTDCWYPLWNAGYRLWNKTASSRVIYTSINGANIYDYTSGAYDSTDSFVSANQATLRKYLRATTNAEAANIINYIRGTDISGKRSRQFTVYDDASGGTAKKTWKLGDIVYSTPTAVSTPAENYEKIYSDATYIDFKQEYSNRRQVIYVGANDGMLHAFNAGFFDKNNLKFWKGYSGGVYSDTDPTFSNTEIGDELWAFIPRDLLPHLKWLWLPEYTHVYFVDLKPKVTDARIFCGDSDAPPGCINGQNGVDHPHGWGTILIGGFKLGGKSITTESGIGTFSPSYFALDITSPEVPPKLLWTFKDSNLGQTSSYPAVARILNKDSYGTITEDAWFMIVGSGPTAYTVYSDVSSSQQGYVFIVNLKTGVLSRSISTSDNKAFMADPITVDVSLDYKVDVVYIGETYLSGTNSTGKMFRLTTKSNTNPANWALSTIAIPSGNNPITAAPAAALDTRGNLWVFFGTGKFWGAADKTNEDAQSFYGIKDSCKPWLNYTCTSTMSNFLDVSSASVDVGATNITGLGISPNACGDALNVEWCDVLFAIYNSDGWVINFPSVPGHTAFIGERSIHKPLVLGGLVVFPTFMPVGDICQAGGNSYVYAPFYETGTAYKNYVFSEELLSQPATVSREKYLGFGLPSSIGATITKDGKLKGFAQQSTGAVIEIEQLTPFSLKSGTAGWRSECQ